MKILNCNRAAKFLSTQLVILARDKKKLRYIFDPCGWSYTLVQMCNLKSKSWIDSNHQIVLDWFKMFLTWVKAQNSLLKSNFWTYPNRFGQVQNRFRPIEGQSISYWNILQNKTFFSSGKSLEASKNSSKIPWHLASRM